jgi:queuine tRNA-ribosyltransferase catalytic subunit
MREHCIKSVNLNKYSGVAIGGLAGGEEKSSFWETVSNSTKLLPEDKPRYLMGVGYPEDLVVCVCLGIDMFDCVFSTRTARFGTAFTSKGFLKIRGEHKFDFTPIDSEC